jgi:ribosomal protein L11 methyltransferase
MILPDARLFIYEVRGEWIGDESPPSSFIGVWNEEEFSYLFFTAAQDDYVAAVAARCGLTLGTRHEMTYADWQTGLPTQGIRVGTLSIVPPGHPSPCPGAILLDPSVVFGDASHPTTLACLRLLEALLSRHDAAKVLDLGTGSGILALAAATLGVERIVAVDKNRLAAETARKNVERNGLSDRIEIHEADARHFIHEPHDVVLANLPFQVLRELDPLRSASLHKSWIVSGINREQADLLKELFDDQGFRIDEEEEDKPWVTFVATQHQLTPSA